jgi:folate-binding protein YgfZ
MGFPVIAATETTPAPDALALLALTGPDAISFLHGQCTQDLRSLAVGDATRAAILSSQGRILALPWVRRTAEGLRCLLPADLVDALQQHLARYVLRAKVTLSRADVMAPDLIAPRQARAASTASDWDVAGIECGIPEVVATSSGEWIPQMLNLDLLGAVSFEKGCYTGQEIVARTQHLGRIKRRLFRYRIPGRAPAPLDGLHVNDVKVGEVVCAAAAGTTAECLAVVGLEARDLPLTLADGRVCQPAPLPYAVP